MSFDTRVRLLVVGADPEDQRILRDLLDAIRGWEVALTWAPTYQAGLEALERAHHDVALVGYRLGEKSGLDFVREGRVKREGLPVILLTDPRGADTAPGPRGSDAADHLERDDLTAGTLQRSIRYAIEARRRSGLEARFRAVIANARDLVSVVDADGVLEYVSPSLERVLGFRPDERLGTNLLEHLHREDRAAAEELLEELARAPGATRRFLCRVAHRDGTWRTLDTVARNLLEDPLIRGIIVNSWDVSELGEAQAALERRQAELQERIKDLQCLYGVYRTLQKPDLAWKDTLARVAASIPPGFQFPELLAARVRVGEVTRATPGFRRTGRGIGAPITVGGEELGEVEVCFVGEPPGGAEAAFLAEEQELLAAIADRVGEAVRSRRAEAELRRSEAYFRALAERSGRVVAVLDRTGGIRYVSEQVHSLLEVEPETLLGTSVARLLALDPDDSGAHEAFQRAIREPGTTVEGRAKVRHPLLGVRSLSYNMRSLLDDPAIHGVVLTVHDETPRVEQEDRIRFQAELLDAVGQAVIASDPAGTVVYWNRAAEALYGWSDEEALGRTVFELTTPEAVSAEAAEVLETVAAGRTWSGEFTVRRKDGTVFPAFVTTSPITDRDGNTTGVIGISSDLTERRALEEQLRHAQKMEAIGRLAGGVAHDFNNLLTAIRGHSELLLEELPADSPIAADLAEIQKAGERASALTRQLLAFGRKQVREERILDLRATVEEIEALLRRLLPSRLRLEIETAAEPVPVRADAGQLHQLVLNLATNARDATPEEGSVTIRVDTVGPGHGAPNGEGRIAAGAAARLTVRDAGVGIAAEDLPHIFDPFYTTKAEGRGTGLGLSTVFGIVTQSGGEVRVDSVPGRGSTFTVLLPLDEGEPDPPATSESEARPTSGEETVLVVEDDPAVRQIAKRVLERVGYSVLEAANGVEALRIAESHPTEIDLVLSDVVMPEMGGTKLADSLRRDHPNVRVVLTSGYSEEDLLGDVRDKGAAFLEKPFTMDALTRVVRDVLDG